MTSILNFKRVLCPLFLEEEEEGGSRILLYTERTCLNGYLSLH